MPDICTACTCHEFEWEDVKSDQYDFRGLLITINRKPNSIQLYSFNAAANGLELVAVRYSTDQVIWKRMCKLQLPSVARSPVCFPTFVAEGHLQMKNRIYFRIFLKELVDDYCFCLVDWQHGQQLWSAATNRQFTDVEFVVGGKSFHAHRASLQPEVRTLPKCSARLRHWQNTRSPIAILVHSSSCCSSCTRAVFRNRRTRISFRQPGITGSPLCNQFVSGR